MATFFGEVNETKCRSFWDDYGSDEETKYGIKKSVFTASILDEDAFVSKYALMIVVHDKKMTDFIRPCLLTDKASIIATFSEEKSDDDDIEQQKSKRNLSVLYKLSEDLVFFVANPFINGTNAHALLIQVEKCMERCSEIVTLCFLPLGYYVPRNVEFSDRTVVRYLRTKPHRSSVYATLLEVPNALGSLPAAVLTLCHFKKLSAVVYVFYSDLSYVSATIATQLLDLMKKITHNLPTQVVTFSDLEEKLVNSTNNDSVMSSNLYL